MGHLWWNKPMPIEREGTTGWKMVPLKPINEPLVPVGPFTDFSLLGGTAIYAGQDTSSPYHPDGLEGSLLSHFMRRNVAIRLLAANRLLPPGHIFWLWDCYRPLKVQKSLYESCASKVKNAHPSWSEDTVNAEAQRFASLPSYDPSRPSPHNTGGSIDLSIARLPAADQRRARKLWLQATMIRKIWGDDAEKGSPDWAWQKVFRLEMELWEIYRQKTKLLNMGTVFDAVEPATETAYYERRLREGRLTASEKELLRNRRLLYWTLRYVGFSSYEDEWWHFDQGNQFAAKREGKVARYGATNLSYQNLWWEQVRRGNWNRTIRILAGENVSNPSDKIWFDGKLGNWIKRPDWVYRALRFSQQITPQTVKRDPRISSHHLAAVI